VRIPVQLRMVLVLHDMEELSSDQVAQILGLKGEPFGFGFTGLAFRYAKR
jgi:hypothetical protein